MLTHVWGNPKSPLAHWWHQQVEHPAGLPEPEGAKYIAVTEGLAATRPMSAVGKSPGKGQWPGVDAPWQPQVAQYADPAWKPNVPPGRSEEPCWGWAKGTCILKDCPNGRSHRGPKGKGKQGQKGKKGDGKNGGAWVAPKAKVKAWQKESNKANKKQRGGHNPHY